MWSAVKGPVESGPICDKYVQNEVNLMFTRQFHLWRSVFSSLDLYGSSSMEYVLSSMEKVRSFSL